MPVAPVSRMNKEEIRRLSRLHCKHGMPYIAHYSCYLRDMPKQRVGVFDIETSHLKASLGVMLCYKIQILGTNEIVGRTITKHEVLSPDCDKKIVRECIKDISGCDRLITYFGSRFDLKFIRTRALIHGLDFPAYGEIVGTDLYYMVRNRFQLHSNRLQTACEVLLGKSEKTTFNTMMWMKALQGSKEALNYIDEHCEKDVADTARLYLKVNKFSIETNTSI